MIILSKIHFSDIQSHSLETFPDECCGAMLGFIENDIKYCKELISLNNHSDENKRRRFMITDKDYMNVEKIAKDKQLQLLGFYHSHPNHPAQPSETDLKYAWPFFSYLIQSIFEKTIKELNSFVLDIETNQFIAEELKVDYISAT